MIGPNPYLFCGVVSASLHLHSSKLQTFSMTRLFPSALPFLRCWVQSLLFPFYVERTHHSTYTWKTWSKVMLQQSQDPSSDDLASEFTFSNHGRIRCHVFRLNSLAHFAYNIVSFLFKGLYTWPINFTTTLPTKHAQAVNLEAWEFKPYNHV